MAADVGELARFAALAEAAALTGERERAASLYEALSPYEGACIPGPEAGMGGASVAYYLGVLARTIGRLEAAASHLARALSEHTATGEDRWAAKVRCELARVLLARGDEGSRRRALAEVDAVLAWAPAQNTPLGDEAAGLQARAEQGDAGRANVIRCEGEIWTLTFEGHTCHVRDTRGLHWLTVLLRHPWREFPVLVLAAAAGRAPWASDDGRPDLAAIERGRVRVTRAMRSAIERIAAVHPALGRHLASTVRTGRVCAYTPDPRLPVDWVS